MNRKIFLSSNVVKNCGRGKGNDKTDSLSLSNNAFMAYIAICMNSYPDRERFCISISGLCFDLCNNTNWSDRFYRGIKSGLQELQDKQVIDAEPLPKSGYAITYKPVDTKNEFFTNVYDNEIHKIIDIYSKYPSLLRYFCVLISSLNHNTTQYTDTQYTYHADIGYQSLKWLSDTAAISNKTAISYNEVLEDLQLIYIHKHIPYMSKDNKLKSLTNNYGRFADKAQIDMFANWYAKENGFLTSDEKLKIQAGNNSRSLMQQYHRLEKYVRQEQGGYNYDSAAAQQIYDFAVQRKLDLSVFDSYREGDRYAWDPEPTEKENSYAAFRGIVQATKQEDSLDDFLPDWNIPVYQERQPEQPDPEVALARYKHEQEEQRKKEETAEDPDEVQDPDAWLDSL